MRAGSEAGCSGFVAAGAGAIRSAGARGTGRIGTTWVQQQKQSSSGLWGEPVRLRLPALPVSAQAEGARISITRRSTPALRTNARATHRTTLCQGDIATL